jgi:prepilin-type N-terminal cleavage/methylation domain-containing protein
MMPLSRRTQPIRSNSAERTFRQRGFTLVEALAGISILGLVVGTVIFGLSQLNYYASVNRLYTAAQTLAQNQIDLILSKGPFNPALNQSPTPNVLQTGTYYSDPTTPDTLYGEPRNVPIYTDPHDNQQVVVGTIATQITDPGISVNGVSLNLRQATVTVTYTFRNQTFTVKMDTMRTSDV